MGGLIGGIVSAIIGSRAAKKDRKAQAKAQESAIEAALTGFNYVKDSPLSQGAQQSGLEAQGLISGLLGLGGNEAAARAAFDRYLDSTGFNFRFDRGMDAITGNRAAAGLLNSGSTLKGLNSFGQGIASDEFANFLAQLQGVQATGLNQLNNVGSLGSTAGGAAANITTQGEAAQRAIRRRGTEDLVSGLGTAGEALRGMFMNRQNGTGRSFFDYL